MSEAAPEVGSAPPDATPYQSLYRRYRPQRFGDVRGQDHVTRALGNAVREGRVSHAYLFSGPRGTGKTSTARILAKALNCTAVGDGEPCCACASCLAVQAGSSLDVHELDAASNNGVDAMRDLVARAALGTPGRWKVYIVDEVHMLSTAASNTLLKTLEEPPGHVVFVLATTDPQKVLPTIRSRTQHYEFRLLGADVLASLLADVNVDASLGVPAEAIELVVRRGKGSARDALSALDQVAAAGDVDDAPPATDELVEALCERDAGRALTAVAAACAAGLDPRRLAVDLLEHLRDAFLATMAPDLVDLPDTGRERAEDQARRLGAPATVRAMEVIGQAQVDMREALDPRITLETALVRLARPDADVSPAALLERIERLERRLSGHVSEPSRALARDEARHAGTPAAARGDGHSDAGDEAAGAVAAQGGAGDHRGAPALGALRARAPSRGAPSPPPGVPGPREARDERRAFLTGADVGAVREAAAKQVRGAAPSNKGRQEAAGGGLPSRDELTKAWGDRILASLSGRSKARFGAGRFSAVAGGHAVFALPNEHYLGRCAEVKAEVEDALAAHFGVPVPLRLVVDDAPGTAGAGPEPEGGGVDDDVEDVAGWQDADRAVTSPEDRLMQAFPGAEEVT